jgi:hypothetical protein
VLRGQGDAEAIRVFAEAFGQDVNFFDFYRSMQAYRTALGGDGATSFVLSPQSEFFRYFNDFDVRGEKAASRAPRIWRSGPPPRRRCRPPSATRRPRSRRRPRWHRCSFLLPSRGSPRRRRSPGRRRRSRS